MDHIAESIIAEVGGSGGGSAPRMVSVEELLPADSPRLAGEDDDHVRSMTLVADLPPILVHRATMRVIDGMHRLRAATLRGDREIAVRFFDGDAGSAFVQAVVANVYNGLPLSRSDRAAAAARIVTTHPHWSDRAVATATGLAPATVAAVRRRATDQTAQSNMRIGRDGRVRPLSTAEGRERASTLLTARPDASLRQVARAAGISVGTARDVRERLRRGEDPLPKRLRVRSEREAPQAPAEPVEDTDQNRLLETLRNDPALKFNESGRTLLRLFTAHPVRIGPMVELLSTTPPHCLPAMARLARGYAERWRRLAAEFDHRSATEQ